MKNQKGFTLVELLVGITITTMIFLTAGSVIGLFFRTDSKTERVETLEIAKNEILAEVSNAVRWSPSVTFTGGDLGSVKTVDSEFTIVDGRLRKNGEPITPQDVTITKFMIQNLSAAPSLKSLAIQVEIESTQNTTTKDAFTLVVSQRKTEINI